MRICILVVAAALLITACGGSGSGDSHSNFADVDEVVASLDRHTVYDPSEPLYALIGAYHGMKYSMEPGPFRIEIYVYKDKGRMSQEAREAEDQAAEFKSTEDTIVRTESNVLLLMYHAHDGDPPAAADMDRLVADLRD